MESQCQWAVTINAPKVQIPQLHSCLSKFFLPFWSVTVSLSGWHDHDDDHVSCLCCYVVLPHCFALYCYIVLHCSVCLYNCSTLIIHCIQCIVIIILYVWYSSSVQIMMMDITPVLFVVMAQMLVGLPSEGDVNL